MSLRFPEDLNAWQRWQNSRNRVRRIKHAFGKPQNETALRLVSTGPNPEILIAIDATTPTAIAAFLEPIKHLAGTEVAVLSTVNIDHLLPLAQTLSKAPDSIKVVFSGGHYLRAGAQAQKIAENCGVKHVVAQHGLLTPFAPPLPSNAHGLSFSAADSEFWASGRGDLTFEVVGSQLLWAAARQKQATLLDETPIFLGQLHGAELSRRITGGAAKKFCKMVTAEYRPHPAETDLLSRLQHRIWARRGMHITFVATPLRDAGRPVVSVFSTGVLEAAAAGLPAWVYCPHPPVWVEEFWARYGMNRWGEAPTPAPTTPDKEPALAIAECLLRFV
jgi:hypothetical protein